MGLKSLKCGAGRKKREAESEHGLLGAVVQLPQPGALLWPCTRPVASLLLLAQDCAVTLRGSFIAACATAPSPIKQSYPCFLSLFLCLANNQESKALISLVQQLLFQGHLAQLSSQITPHTCAGCCRSATSKKTQAGLGLPPAFLLLVLLLKVSNPNP